MQYDTLMRKAQLCKQAAIACKNDGMCFIWWSKAMELATMAERAKRWKR